MMAFTNDGQLKPELVAARDARYGKSMEDLKESRKGIEPPAAIDPGANHWEKLGKAWQAKMEEGKFTHVGH